MRPTTWLHIAAVLTIAGAAASAQALTIRVMDQIGPDPAAQEGRASIVSQAANLYASAPQFNIAVIDDFVLDAETVLQRLDVALFATNGWGAFQGLSVKVFDHQPTANEGLHGSGVRNWLVTTPNIASRSWTQHAHGRLLDATLSETAALAPGRYWLLLAAVNNSFVSDIGVFLSGFAGFPDNANARQIGSALWGGGGDRPLFGNAAMRLWGDQAIAVPEPQTYVLMLLGLGGLCWRVRRTGTGA